MKPINSKYLIEGIEGFFFGSDGHLYKFPFVSGKRFIGLKKISMDKENQRYRMNGKWWSKKQLQGKLYLNPKPEIINEIIDLLTIACLVSAVNLILI